MKKAKSMMMLDRSAWKVKLNDNELKEAHARGGKRRVQQVREKFQTKRDKALTLRANGMKFKDIAIKLEVSTKTVQRWKLPKY
jgi:DNA-binding NarL/FixJ family response regulator